MVINTLIFFACSETGAWFLQIWGRTIHMGCQMLCKEFVSLCLVFWIASFAKIFINM